VASEQNAEEILGSAKAGYAAFSWGDLDAAMAQMADDIEWVVPGESVVSGTYHGKEEFRAFFMKLAETSYTQEAQLFLGDEEQVMVLLHTTLAGESSDQVDILTYRDGKVVKGRSVLDTLLGKRVLGTK
jgi:ketosteroid isomerase-like protein